MNITHVSQKCSLLQFFYPLSRYRHYIMCTRFSDIHLIIFYSKYKYDRNDMSIKGTDWQTNRKQSKMMILTNINKLVQSLEKIYLQGKPAGQRRADEAASAQYLRLFWQGFFVKMLTSTQNCAEMWSWPMPSSRNPMTQWLLIRNYYKKFIFWWNLWKR